MPASCPYCGAILNFGLKFCIVCGRHTTSNEISKLGGLKSGIRQQDLTRRLDDNLSSSDFEKARQSTKLRRHVRSLSEQLFYLLIGATLFFCAIRFTLQAYFPGRAHRILAPLLGKNGMLVEKTLTGEGDEPVAPEKKTDVKKTANKIANKKGTRAKIDRKVAQPKKVENKQAANGRPANWLTQLGSSIMSDSAQPDAQPVRAVQPKQSLQRQKKTKRRRKWRRHKTHQKNAIRSNTAAATATSHQVAAPPTRPAAASKSAVNAPRSNVINSPSTSTPVVAPNGQ